MALPLSMTLARLARARAIAPRPTAVASSAPSIPLSALTATRASVRAATSPAPAAAPVPPPAAAPVVVPPPAAPAAAAAPAPRWQDAVYAPPWVPPAQRSSNPLVAVPHAIWSGLKDPRIAGLDRSVAARSIPQTSPYDVKMFNPATWLNNIPRVVREDIPGLFRGSEARLLDRSRNALSLAARRTPLLGIQAVAAKGLYDTATAPATPESTAAMEAVYRKPMLVPKVLGSLLYAGGEIATGQESKGSPAHSTIRDTLKRTLGVGLRKIAPPPVPSPSNATGLARLLQLPSVPGAVRSMAAGLATPIADRLGAPNTFNEVMAGVPAQLRKDVAADPLGALNDARGKTMAGSAMHDALAVSPRVAKLYATETLKARKPEIDKAVADAKDRVVRKAEEVGNKVESTAEWLATQGLTGAQARIAKWYQDTKRRMQGTTRPSAPTDTDLAEITEERLRRQPRPRRA